MPINRPRRALGRRAPAGYYSEEANTASAIAEAFAALAAVEAAATVIDMLDEGGDF